ncbi:MAG: hypothetical protein ACOH10_11930 [Rhodoglobus sp.]|uniref:hypothetical protein n=1 Tax=Salinibacterium sp. G-O1 TaxID=3046208 RepID=UPI0024B9528C|nr:hypothetical protein [Salinibacterium sp. G-O1]MDJ0334483.1 hypothetical protein [Salinibacterium sp. G-O1]
MKASRLRVLVAVTLAVTITPALAGCGFNPVESIIEQATGGDVDIGGPSVPESFPSEIPLVDGEVQFGAGMSSDDSRIWNVTIKTNNASALETVKSQLAGAGFTEADGVGGSTDGGSLATFTSDKYNVAVVVTTSDGDTIVNYTVTSIS